MPEAGVQVQLMLTIFFPWMIQCSVHTMSGIFWNVFSVCYLPSFVIFGKYSGLFPQDSCSFSLHIVMCYLVVKSFVLKNLIHDTVHGTVQYICKPPFVGNIFGHWCVSTKYDFHNCDSNISGKISDKTFPVYEIIILLDTATPERFEINALCPTWLNPATDTS